MCVKKKNRKQKPGTMVRLAKSGRYERRWCASVLDGDVLFFRRFFIVFASDQWKFPRKRKTESIYRWKNGIHFSSERQHRALIPPHIELCEVRMFCMFDSDTAYIHIHRLRPYALRERNNINDDDNVNVPTLRVVFCSYNASERKCHSNQTEEICVRVKEKRPRRQLKHWAKREINREKRFVHLLHRRRSSAEDRREAVEHVPIEEPMKREIDAKKCNA